MYAPSEYWKNFNLGTELDILVAFCSTGCSIPQCRLCCGEDAFEFLYGVAVGVERLVKIALILTNTTRRQTKPSSRRR